MSTLDMLADQSPFGRSALAGADAVTAGPSPFTAANNFPSDFLGLSLQDEDNLWGLSPISPSLPSSWNVKAEQAFTNPNLERDLKNSHVRNGQPTPPPYDDKKPSPSGDSYSLTQSQLDGSASDQADHYRRPICSERSGTDNHGSSKRRKVRDSRPSVAGANPIETDNQQQEKAKREKFLERNRLAASKCRQKKKEHTMILESRYKEQSDKKEKLVAEIARLRSEILGLKNEVLKHAQCGDEPIKLHLAQMVKRITYNDAAADCVDAVEVASSSESAATPTAPAALSFGFDDPLQIDPQAASASFDPQFRRDSETSLFSEASFAFSADDNFDDLINV